MTFERETRWITIGDANVLLLHDILGEGSEIEITHADGAVSGIVVPLVGADGYPSDNGGQYPTMADLERISNVVVEYAPAIQALGVDGRVRIAMELSADVDERSSAFEWIELLKQAEDVGLDIGVKEPGELGMAL